jgi:hypothetical protein
MGEKMESPQSSQLSSALSLHDERRSQSIMFIKGSERGSGVSFNTLIFFADRGYAEVQLNDSVMPANGYNAVMTELLVLQHFSFICRSSFIEAQLNYRLTLVGCERISMKRSLAIHYCSKYSSFLLAPRGPANTDKI